MAVQAQQHPSNVLVSEPRNRTRAKDNRSGMPMSLGETFQMQPNITMGMNINQNPTGFAHLFPVYNSVGAMNFNGNQVLNGTVFSDPESDLTCNVSGSRKRAREETMLMTHTQQQQRQHQHHVAQQLTLMNMANMNGIGINNQNSNNNHSPGLGQNIPMVSTGLQLAYEDTGRLNHAPTLNSATTATPTGFGSLFGDDLVAQLQQQQQEIDQLIKLHNEKIRATLEEKRRAHARALLATMEESIISRMKSKEAELERVTRRSLELEERVKQLSVESQIWQNMAKNNDATANALRAKLEQVMAQSREQQMQQNGEGLGDSAVAEDAQSCCNDGDAQDTHSRTLKENRELREQRCCRVCRVNDSSILLLPCRHLCLCKDCETRLEVCPLCKSTKNASVQVYMS